MNAHTANELLFRLLDNAISDADFTALEEWLNSDVQARRYYCRFMEDYGALSLRGTASPAGEEETCLQEELLNENFWRMLSAEEETAPAVAMRVPAEKGVPVLIGKVHREPMVRTVNKTSLLVAVVSLAALLVMVGYVYLAPPAPYEVATVKDSLDAEWSSELSLRAGTRLSSYTKPIRLTRGIVQLVTDEQVAVVLEAPAEFRFISYSEIALHYGKLFAHVSGKGLGFSVATPNAKVVDLGTEFGVLCHIDGNTEVHLYKGKANLFAGQKNENKRSEFLTAGTARKVDRTDSGINAILLEKDVVVRAIDSKSNFIWRGESVNLADIIGGGDGFGTGRLDAGIDAVTGQAMHSLAQTDVFTGPDGFVPASNPYVDGLFVPGVTAEGTQVTSTGLGTDAFAKTSGVMWGYVFNGAWHEGLDVPRHCLTLNGTALDGIRHPAITMHSNLGVTFDLAALRERLGGVRIASFSSDFGISETVDQWIGVRDLSDWEQTPAVRKFSASRQSSAAFWVFLDGRPVLCQTVSNVEGGHVHVPIGDDVRFLTLAVTEADDTFMFDWGVFARPELILEPTEPQPLRQVNF